MRKEVVGLVPCHSWTHRVPRLSLCAEWGWVEGCQVEEARDDQRVENWLPAGVSKASWGWGPNQRTLGFPTRRATRRCWSRGVLSKGHESRTPDSQDNFLPGPLWATGCVNSTTPSPHLLKGAAFRWTSYFSPTWERTCHHPTSTHFFLPFHIFSQKNTLFFFSLSNHGLFS